MNLWRELRSLRIWQIGRHLAVAVVADPGLLYKPLAIPNLLKQAGGEHEQTAVQIAHIAY